MATLHNYKCHKCGFSILSFYHLKMETIVYFLVLDIFINEQNAITSLQRIGYIGIYT